MVKEKNILNLLSESRVYAQVGRTLGKPGPRPVPEDLWSTTPPRTTWRDVRCGRNEFLLWGCSIWKASCSWMPCYWSTAWRPAASVSPEGLSDCTRPLDRLFVSCALVILLPGMVPGTQMCSKRVGWMSVKETMLVWGDIWIRECSRWRKNEWVNLWHAIRGVTVMDHFPIDGAPKEELKIWLTLPQERRWAIAPLAWEVPFGLWRKVPREQLGLAYSLLLGGNLSGPWDESMLDIKNKT